MKHFIILFSLIFITSFSLHAQRTSRTKASSIKKDDKVTKRVPQRQVNSKNITLRTSRTSQNNRTESNFSRVTDRVTPRTVEHPRTRPVRRDVRETRTSDNNINHRSRPTRTVNHRHHNTGNRVTTSGRVGINQHRVVRPPVRDRRVYHHGYRPKAYVHVGFHGYRVYHYPVHIHDHFYFHYPIVLFESYMPEYEYPWAIYNSKDNPNEAYIEGKVVEVRFIRRTGRFVLYFGRYSPNESAVVILSERLSRRFLHNKRAIRKLRGEYVSISGEFNDYGNVLTIKVFDVEHIYVNDTPFIYFVY